MAKAQGRWSQKRPQKWVPKNGHHFTEKGKTLGSVVDSDRKRDPKEGQTCDKMPDPPVWLKEDKRLTKMLQKGARRGKQSEAC